MHRSSIALPFLFAAAAAAAAACGNTPGTSDPDARVTDAGPPNVTVTVYTYDGPAAGLPVAFFEQDGTPDGVVTTDAAGKARAHIGAGASATVDLRPIATPNLYIKFESVLDLRPGDDVTIGTAHQDPGSSDTISLTVTFPAHAGAVSYHATSDCGGGGVNVQQSPAVLLVPAACGGKEAKVTVIAYDVGQLSGYGGLPIAYLAPVATTMTAGSTIDLGAATWTPTVDGTVSLTHVPEPHVFVQRCNWAGCSSVSGSTDTAHSASLKVPVVPVGPTTLFVQASFPASNGAHVQYDRSQRMLVQTIGTDQGDLALDASAALLPGVSAGLDPDHHTAAVYGAAGDLLRYTIYTSAGQWELITTPVATLVLPPPPEGVSYSHSQTGPGGYPAPIGNIYSIDLPDADGWEAVRVHAWDRAHEDLYVPVPGSRQSMSYTY